MQFDHFIDSLSNLHNITAREDGEMLQEVKQTVNELRKIENITRETLSRFIKENPHSVPIIATCSGLGQEQFKNQLRRLLGTTGWVNLARKNPDQLIQVLDDEFDLVGQISKDLSKQEFG